MIKKFKILEKAVNGYSVFVEIDGLIREYKSYIKEFEGLKLLVGRGTLFGTVDIFEFTENLISGQEYDLNQVNYSINSTGYITITTPSNYLKSAHDIIDYTWNNPFMKFRDIYAKDIDNNKKYQVDHKNGIKLDCRPENLETVLREVNALRAMLNYPDSNGVYEGYFRNHMEVVMRSSEERIFESIRSILEEMTGVHHKEVTRILSIITDCKPKN